MSNLSDFRNFVLEKRPNLSKSQLAELDSFISEQEARDIAAAGVPLEEIESDPTLRSIQASQVATGTYKSPLTETQKSTQASAKTLASDVQQLEANRKRVSSLLRGVGQPIKKGFQFLDKGDVDAFEGLQGNVAYTMAAAVAQQKGQGVSDKDVKAFKDALPNLGDTEKGAQNKLRDVAGQVKSRLIEAGMSEEEATNFSNSFLTELGLSTETTSEVESPIPSFSQVEPGAEGDISLQAVAQATKEGYFSGKSLGEFGQNALNDLQDLVEGTINLPKVLSQAGQEMAEQEPSVYGPGVDFARTETGQNMIMGIVDEYKSLITHPLEHFYNHPVNTVLAVIPFLSAAKKLRAGRVADEVAVAETAVSETRTVLPKIPSTPEEVATQAIQKSRIFPTRGEIASKTYSSAFIVPTKLAKNLDPLGTSTKMLEYGVSGSLDDLGRISETVTGADGILTRVTRNSIGNISGEVRVPNMVSSAENVLKDVIELTPTEESKILQNIAASEKPGQQIMKMNPLDAYDNAKRLEALGYQYLNTNTYLTGNVKNIGIGRAYLAAADEIMVQLEKAVGEQNILAGYKNPEVINELSSVSPKLAEDFQKANTLKDVRNLQAPFVRLNRMVDLTNQAANTAFKSMGRQVGGAIFKSALGGVPGFAVGGPVGGVAGLVAGQVFGPPIEAAIEAMRPSILTKASKLIAR